jgi:hypothetical protein
MSVAYHPGQTLTQEDLKILIRDNVGNLVDPYYIRYSIFDYTTGVEVLIGAPDQVPATMGMGQYYVSATMPMDANIGDWLVRWNFRETVTSPVVQVVQEFNIVATEVKTDITSIDSEQLMVRRLRIILRDNNPDRNYSVSGGEIISFKVDGELYDLTIKDFWEIINDGRNGGL